MGADRRRKPHPSGVQLGARRERAACLRAVADAEAVWRGGRDLGRGEFALRVLACVRAAIEARDKGGS